MMIELLRRRQLREKYAVLWLLVAVAVAALAIFPGLLDFAAHHVGGHLKVAPEHINLHARSVVRRSTPASACTSMSAMRSAASRAE